MATSQNAKIRRTYQAISPEIKIAPVLVRQLEVQRWKEAIDAAWSVYSPRRRMLYELYKTVLLDAHLLSVQNKRRMGVTNKIITWVPDDPEAAISDEVRNLIQYGIIEAPWFHNFCRHAADSVAWGHSLIELIPGDDGYIRDCKLINRINVRPEYGQLLLNYADESKYILYRDDPYYSTYLIEAGGVYDLGLLMSAAFYVIIKRSGFGDWAQLAEIFGMPIRKGTYNPFDDYSRDKLYNGLLNMGSAGVIIHPEGTSVDLMQANGTANSSVHKDLVDKCDEQVSKLFLGQTMTTDQGSSRSQGEVHKDVEEEINAEDIIMMEHLLNWQFKNKMVKLGYPLAEGRFKVDTKIQLDQQTLIDIAIKVNSKVPIEKKYFYETFGIPMPDPMADQEDLVAPAPAQEPAPGNQPDPAQQGKHEKKKPEASIVTCCHTEPFAALTWEQLSEAERNLVDTLGEMKHSPDFDQATFDLNREKLVQAIKMGLQFESDYGHPDNVAYTMMEVNVNRFGYNKNVEQMLQLNEALRKHKDNYSDFKAEATRIMSTFNHEYLRTEYDTAIAVAQNASAWNLQKAQQNDYPYLQYQTIGDARVRPEHAALDGKIFSIADKSWQAVYPPNGYNCRCEMIQLRADQVNKSEVIKGPEAKGLLGDAWDEMVKTGFDVNRGETNEVFDANHAYLDKLKDAPDVNALDYKTLNLPALSEMKDLPALPVDIHANANTVKHQFITNKVHNEYLNRDYMLFKDYAGREVGIDEPTLDKHLKGEYISDAEQRDKLFHNVPDILLNPREVWMTKEGNVAKYTYCKFFDGEMMVVPVDVNLKTFRPLEINSWYVLKGGKESDVRRGVLIKK